MQTKSGKDIFPIGIGTWGIAGTFNPNDPNAKYKGAEPEHGNEEVGIDAIRYSISKGQNHIDCAELYGGFYTDEVIGRALVGLKREDLYIADKLWKTSVATGAVRPVVEQMLKKLGTDYLDMLYIHAPWDDVNWMEAIPQINKLIEEGIVRHFGVSNFSVEQMGKAMEMSNHPILANQMNYNVLYKREVDDDFRAFCSENNIQLIAYQPVKRQEVLQNEVIQDIARTHGATPAQVALAWLITKNALPIPKAIDKKHIDENVNAVNLRLSLEEINLLDTVR